MVTNRSHEVARHGDFAEFRMKQGAGRLLAGACRVRVKIGQGLQLVCALLVSATTSVWASTDLPPRSLSFAYRATHPVFPLPHATLASLRDPEVDVLILDEAAASDFEESTPPDVGAKPRAPTQPGICRIVADVANSNNLPVPFFANLIWAESSFNFRTISRAGAQGIAQFMPKTAVMYGLENPFEPVHAINVSARFLVELRDQFGNLGLAAAAYNAGPRRVTNWLANRGALPRETQNYVRKITGRSVEQWVGAQNIARAQIEPMPAKAPCIEVAEAVLEQTRVARVANLMRELTASTASVRSEETSLVAQKRDKGEAKTANKGEAKIAEAKIAKGEAKFALAQSDRNPPFRFAKLRPSVKDLRSKSEVAEVKPSKLEASSVAKRGAKESIKLAQQKAKKPGRKQVEKIAAKPSKAESVGKAAPAASNNPTAKSDAARNRNRAPRRTQVAQSGDNHLH
jgi:hypothetical protein